MNYSKDESRDSTVCIATGYGLANQVIGVRVPVGARIFTSPYHQDLLCGPGGNAAGA
jgi:hypothetical protein